jgi:hypothetical protein
MQPAALGDPGACVGWPGSYQPLADHSNSYSGSNKGVRGSGSNRSRSGKQHQQQQQEAGCCEMRSMRIHAHGVTPSGCAVSVTVMLRLVHAPSTDLPPDCSRPLCLPFCCVLLLQDPKSLLLAWRRVAAWTDPTHPSLVGGSSRRISRRS